MKKPWRALLLLLIVLTLALLTHALIVRVRSSPLFIAEANFARIQPGMSMEDVLEIMGPYNHHGFQTDTWRLDPVRGKTWHLTVRYDVQPMPVTNSRVTGKEAIGNLSWFDRVTSYLAH
jgi:hypothetical protein